MKDIKHNYRHGVKARLGRHHFIFWRDESVLFNYVYYPQSLDEFDAVIVFGTKNVLFDDEWLRERKWEPHLNRYVQNGGRIFGINL